MDLKVAKVLPGGNPTIIVETAVAPTERANVATVLMSNNYLCAEQVGFLVPPHNPQKADMRLEMMGDELCINALRSAAALLYSRNQSKPLIRLESSGFNGVLECFNEMRDETLVTDIRLKIPLVIDQNDDSVTVTLDGITHLVRKVEQLPSDSEAKDEFRSFMQANAQLDSIPACGFMPYVETEDHITLKPLVYVRDTESMIFETGCGSGSIAVALAKFNGETQCTQILQPSGELYVVNVNQTEHHAVAVHLSSHVSIIVTGVASIPSALL
ncbi:MAG: hypothetical protein M0P69_04760 [Bacteroidales bacterium]|nr:hypothetical protein [Bacteroidales bacterium]